MRIAFNATGCGLGNNGGSKTIIKSAEVLKELGHEVYILANTNNYTWHNTKVCVLGDKQAQPDTIINVSVWDVESTLESSVSNKIWWLRGWEIWVKGEQWFLDQVKKFNDAGGRIICNASGLVRELRKHGIYSELCFAGLDLDFWKDYGFRGHNNKLTIGGLYSKKHKTKNYKHFEMVMDYYGDKFNYKVLRDNLNNAQLRNFYNECDIWVATSELEGFHQVPAEAALCGCKVISYNSDLNGTFDYNFFFSMYNKVEHVTDGHFINQTIEFYKQTRGEQRQIGDIKEKIGSRIDNMKKFVELIK